MTQIAEVDKYIANLSGWKGEILKILREIIHEAHPEIEETWKWGVPVFVHKTMVCAISDFKEHVKINFFKGAQIEDPKKLFNNGFESKAHRSIDFKKGDIVDAEGIKELVRAAINLKM